MLPSLSFTELTPELTADVRNATQILLPVSDDFEGVTMEFIDDLDPESIPLSRLEKLLIEIEGMKTTHLGYIYIFPTAQCTNKPVQTDTTQPNDATLKTVLDQHIISQGGSHVTQTDDAYLQLQTDTNQLLETSSKYKQSISTSSVTTNKGVLNNNNYASGEGAYPTLVSAEVQTDPLSQLPSLGESRQQLFQGLPETEIKDISSEDDISVSKDGPGDKPTTKHSDVNRDKNIQIYTTVSHDEYVESDTDSFESTTDTQKDAVESIGDLLHDNRHDKKKDTDITDDNGEILPDEKTSVTKEKITNLKSSADEVAAGQAPDESEIDDLKDTSRVLVMKMEREMANIKGTDGDVSVAKTSTSQGQEPKDALSQTQPITMGDKSNQSFKNMNQGNQTKAITMLEKSSEMNQDKSSGTQTDEICTEKQETQVPDVTHFLSQTEAISSAERQSQTEQVVARDEGSQTEQSTVIKNTDSQTQKVPVVTSHSQTEVVTTGDVISQTDVAPVKDIDSQTASVPLKDGDSQIEPLIDENVPLGISPRRKAPTSQKQVMESESQTDLTESMLLTILRSSSSHVAEGCSDLSLIGAFGYENTRHLVQSSDEGPAGYGEIVASGTGYKERQSSTSSSRFKEGSKVESKRNRREKKFGLVEALSSDRNDEEKLLDVSTDGSEGNVQFPDFLDGPGDSTALSADAESMVADQAFGADNGEGYLPDLVSRDDRLLSGVAGGKDAKGQGPQGDEAAIGLIAQQRGTGRKTPSRSKIPQKEKMRLQQGPQLTTTDAEFLSEASAGGFTMSGESSPSRLLLKGSEERKEQSAELASGTELSTLTETETTLRLRRKRKPPVIIKYAEEDKVGDLCTNFCRCCLPPYMLFLLLLALACLLSLFEPDSRCCFENHYPSTFGIMMTYPNGPPPI